MKINSRFPAMAFAFLALVAATAITANAQQNKIEGGWLFNVTVPSGTPGPATFLALDSFATGGGWSGHASTDSVAGWSAAHGTWKWETNRVVITQYQFSQDSAGIPTGLVIIHKQVHFTGPDTLAGSSSVSFCDLNGQNCFSPPANALVVATRIKASGPSTP